MVVGGRAERIEYLLLHAFTSLDYIVPDKQYGKKDNYLPGMLGFDPLGKDSPAMREAEITNGRVAMIAITVFALEEALTKAPIFPISLFH